MKKNQSNVNKMKSIRNVVRNVQYIVLMKINVKHVQLFVIVDVSVRMVIVVTLTHYNVYYLKNVVKSRMIITAEQ